MKFRFGGGADVRRIRLGADIRPFGSRSAPLEGQYGWLVKNGRETVLSKCFAGCSADDTLTKLRTRWPGMIAKTTAQRQQHRR